MLDINMQKSDRNLPIIITMSFMTILLMLGLDSEWLAKNGQNTIHYHWLSAISTRDPESALLFKDELLNEAKEGKFTGSSHSKV